MIRSRTVAALAGAVLVADVVSLVVLEPSPPEVEVASPGDDPTPAEASGESLDEQLLRVQGHVERIRGHAFPAPPVVRIDTKATMRAEVEAQVEAYTEADADLDARLLVALGKLPPGTDLRALLVTAYGDQVAGFYDPETTELVVGTDDPTQRVGRLDEVTLAHELGHSLVDAVVGLPDLEAFDESAGDALAAAQALVEGDATALMDEYIETAFSPIDAMLLAREALGMVDELEAMTLLPPFLQRSLEFPYIEGAAFVRHLLAEGGWAAVDAAYVTPPTTTLEILDPDRYGQVEPTEPRAFGDLTGWEADRELDFGALDLLLLLEDTGLPVATPRQVALTWTGGAVKQWSRDIDGADTDTAVAVHVTHAGGAEPCDALRTAWTAMFPEAVRTDTGSDTTWDGPTRDAVLVCDDGEVRLGIAPDLDTANRAIGD